MLTFWGSLVRLMKILSNSCDYCNRAFHGNYSTVEAHLLESSGSDVEACGGLTDTIRAQLENEFAAAKESNAGTMSPSAASSYSSGMSVTGKAIIQPMKRKKSADLDDGLYEKCRKLLDAMIVKMFYSSAMPLEVAINPYYQSSFSLATRKKDIPGCDDVEEARMEQQNHWNSQVSRIFYYSWLPLNVTRNPYYNISFRLATMIHIPGYVPPGLKALTTTLLKQERTCIEGWQGTIKSMWSKAGVTIICDGWSDAERRPVINILAVSESGPVFIGAIYNGDKVKRKSYVARKLIAAIEDVGPENVIQVITDNYPVCGGAGVLIEEKYNHIQWMPSVAHSLSLALKQICAAMSTDNVALEDCRWISEVVEASANIKNFIVDHSMELSMFDEFGELKMLTIADTRFASDIVMLKRFRSIKQSLRGLVISD